MHLVVKPGQLLPRNNDVAFADRNVADDPRFRCCNLNRSIRGDESVDRFGGNGRLDQARKRNGT